MSRVTFTVDENGYLRQICADQEVYIVAPGVPKDRGYK